MSPMWIVFAALAVLAISQADVTIKLEKYDNPADRLQDGTNCEPFGISKCDPYFILTVRNSFNTSLVSTYTSTHTDDVSSVDFGSFIGFLNPVTAKVPNGTVVDITIVAMDDDPIGEHELIGTFNYFYVAGQTPKRESRVSGTSTVTVLFNTTRF
ncbi:uncharacterized protein LOC129592661 [Paramacrobiotus metropolitanus]|uniref:uncharacterized protein LOC129592661 n=1 Tax=Paramacrobiotus metropolitanus TaxID=2943436 RepID=UPI00244581AE|nr:uncharacterized protein LOC129592661 [Paramacrobiotus metropolitanus]